MDKPTKTEAKQQGFFQACHDRFLKAKASAGEISHFYLLQLSESEMISNPEREKMNMHIEGFFVSTIIPVYNGEAYLAEAVESVQRQNCEPLEIIIVDDGSMDGTAKITAALKGNVCYFYQFNSGPPVARNKGLRMALGNVIAFLDADDLWSENKLDIQLAHLARDSSLEIILGYTQLIRPSKSEHNKITYEKHLEPWPAMSLGSAIMRKSVFDKVGFFDEAQVYDDDVDWLLRAKELSINTLIHPEITQFYRRHKDNITNQRQLDQKYFIGALKKSIDRRRQKNGGIVLPMTKWETNQKRPIEDG